MFLLLLTAIIYVQLRPRRTRLASTTGLKSGQVRCLKAPGYLAANVPPSTLNRLSHPAEGHPLLELFLLSLSYHHLSRLLGAAAVQVHGVLLGLVSVPGVTQIEVEPLFTALPE